ncbi:MAG: prepilin-type N-terminal cleavage/methylation domain-containing protein [Oscillatoriales cyanobacterium C42_A2020_001]|nr:prepilin-type N-terminal cleavage/methylation domain-containing protein [Leptolyngbyaceae cyanobacterium C42_A2020_001]
MVRTPTAKRFKRLWFNLRRSRTKGFTLTELLVSIIIGALITFLLLALVVELTRNNQQDAARSQVQQDMQAAMDYMVQDLREAVFVYNGQCLEGNGTPSTQADSATICPGIRNHIPTNVGRDGAKVPVLAFWRTKPLPQRIQDACNAGAASLADADLSTNPLVINEVPCVPGNMYALVVYALDTANPNNIWKGKARLLRYELSQYPDNPNNIADKTVGFVNPLNDPTYTFQQWPYGKVNNTFGNRQITLPTNPAFTVVDFVDTVGARDQNRNPITPSCEEFAPYTNGNPASGKTPQAIANALSPTNAPSSPTDAGSPRQNDENLPMRGFYACVRNGGLGDATGGGQNQDVLLTLVGDVTGQGGFSAQNDDRLQNRLSPLQTRVLIRGVIKKVDQT